MTLRVRDPQRLLFALFLLALGGLGLWLAASLSIGTPLRMGPGYLPRALSIILLLFGAGLAIASFAADGPPLERWSWRGLALILAALCLFGVLVERIGLIPTIPIVALLATLAAPDRRWREAAIFAVCLAFFCALVFRVLLGLPLPLHPF